MKYIFYCIYNTQYLDGKNKVNTTPWITAIGIMMGGSLCWLAIVVEVIYFYVLKRNFPSGSVIAIVILLAFFYLHYFFFIKNKKYEQIYERYRSKNNKQAEQKIVALTYLIVPCITSMLIAMKWHKVI